MSRLTPVKTVELGEQDETPATDSAAAIAEAKKQQAMATQMLMAGIAALSQKAVVAIASLFTLTTAASVFYLWMTAMPTMDTTKIIALSLYSVFILALNWRKI